MLRKHLTIVPALALALTMIPVDASGEQAKRKFNLPPNPLADPLMATNAFLDDHPDLRFRLLGLERYREGKYEEALTFFRRAALYADKPSQGMVAEMLWEGKGAPRDPVLAYAWMDLAAERQYLAFLSLRERYWDALDQTQRDKAVSEGASIYAQYGDAVAEPRLHTALRRGMRSVVGSRLGTVGAVSIHIQGYGEIHASQYFAPKYWDPKMYREWHDQVWQKPLTGQVKVGELETVRGDAQPEAPRGVSPSPPQTDSEEPETPDRDESGLGTKPIP